MASSRYYEDKEADIQPGKISAELKAALNMADNDIPIWIYRMRAIGYPPGWLRKAIVDTEDIFDTDPAPEETDKSGKRKGGPDRDEVKYDHTKLIEYPGFNMPLPPNTTDYHYYYNMPPMLPHQQLDYAKRIMREPASVQKLKRSRTSAGSANDHSGTSKNDDDNDEDDESSGEEEEEVETPASPDPEPGNEQDADNSTASIHNKDLSASTADEKDLDRSSASLANKSNLSLNSLEGIKLVSKGSPMPRPVERLPLERFSQGVVGELLYFENIPNSTGKFDSIRGLLDTMRRSKSETDTSFTGSTKSAKED